VSERACVGRVFVVVCGGVCSNDGVRVCREQILEDDEEVLFCSMHTIKASVLSDGVQQQFVAQVLGMQVDNQVSLKCICAFFFFLFFFLFLRRQSGISQVHLRFFRAAWSSWVSVSMYIFLHRPCTCAYSCTNIAHACACACACIHSYCPHMHTFCTHMCLCRTCLTRTRVCAYMHTRIAHIWALAGTCTRFMHSTDVHVLTHTRVSLLRACLLMHTHDTHLTQTCHKRGEF